MTILKAIRAAIQLPSEVSEFEHRYLARMNRVGLWFFALHIPVFVLVAWFNDTGPLLALALTLGVMAGPVIASKTLSNPRRVSEIFGFSAMLMGGLLAHFGQGPVQIEMHFYFFALLAMLVIFGNPMVVVVAAVTAAVHHLLVWMVLPVSIFNYEAPIWVVAIHAAFVVLESVAAIYIARSFFDNVIGLEKIVNERTAQLDRRNRDMRVVLDNVEQGLVTLDADGAMSTERSAILERWLGAAKGHETFVSYLEHSVPSTALAFEVAYDQLTADMLPPDVAIDQLPTRMSIAERHFGLGYTPIVGTGDERPQLLVMISDVTAAHERERLERDQRELMSIVDRVLTDRIGFVEFFEEADDLVTSIVGDVVDDMAALKRAIHTLKGNAMLFGVQSMAELCHTMETGIVEDHRRPLASEREAMALHWNTLKQKLSAIIDADNGVISVGPEAFTTLLGAAVSGTNPARLAEMIAELKLEPTAARLRRVAEQSQRLARRLGRGDIVVDCVDNGLRLDPERWAGFWSAFVHIVRNAIDHGLERPDDREAAGKTREGHLRLSTVIEAGEFVVRIADDGRGIDWEAVRERALSLGLPSETHADLERALTHDGLSTAGGVTEFSGRGVGVGAVMAACANHGGRMQITSEPGQGSTFAFHFPVSQYTTNPRAFLVAA